MRNILRMGFVFEIRLLSNYMQVCSLSGLVCFSPYFSFHSILEIKPKLFLFPLLREKAEKLLWLQLGGEKSLLLRQGRCQFTELCLLSIQGNMVSQKLHLENSCRDK